MDKDLYEFQIEFSRSTGDGWRDHVQNGVVLAISFEEARKKIDAIDVDGSVNAVHVHMLNDDVVLY